MLTIQINDDRISTGLDAVGRLLADLTPVMDEIGAYLVETTKRRIEAGTTPGGAPFAPRSAATLERYALQGKKPQGGPLRLTDSMRRDSLHHSPGRDFVEWGSSALQSRVMQFGAAKGSLGARSPWGDIPARPFLGISDEDRAGILEIVEEWLMRAAGGGTGQP